MMTERRLWLCADAAMALIWFANLLLIWKVRHDVTWFEENAPIEALQSLWLLIAAAVFMAVGLRREERPHRVELMGIALFVFCMCIRETDVRHTWAEPYLGYAQKHAWQWWFVTPFWLAVVGAALTRLRATALALLRWLASPAGIVLVLGGICYLSGDRAEKGWFSHDRDTGEIVEESLESLGCLFILTSALLATRFGFYARALAARFDRRAAPC